MMKVGPSASGYRPWYQTTVKLLGLRVLVVSIDGKGPVKGQVSCRKMNASEPLKRRRKDYLMSEPTSSSVVGKSMGGTCLLPMRHPAYRRHESMGGICMERENLSLRCEGKASSRRHGKGDNTDARHRGGTPRSSEEVAVMAMERRGRIIWPLLKKETVEVLNRSRRY
jgi:hypothetical protein